MRYSIVPKSAAENVVTASLCGYLAGGDIDCSVRAVMGLQGTDLSEPGLSILRRSLRATIESLQAGEGFDFTTAKNEAMRLFRHP